MMPQTPVAETLIDGARKLLVDSINVLGEAKYNDYIVIGGWCPYLRNEIVEIPHPGTLDVDILFKDGSRDGALKTVSEKFLENDFLPSAKHSFQFLREQSVGEQRLIYNVDFLHPWIAKDEVKKYADHLDLQIRLNPSTKQTKAVKSIGQPVSLILFKHGLYDLYRIDQIEFNLVSFTGMFITKMDSCQKIKRERDSFDIYLAFLNDAIDFKKLVELYHEDELVRESLDGFILHLKKKADFFNKNVGEFYPKGATSPAKVIVERLRQEGFNGNKFTASVK